MQIAGSGLRVKSAVLIDSLRSAPQMRLICSRYVLIQGLQIAQIAACNRLHEIEQRLARWLLMGQDRIDSEDTPGNSRIPGSDARHGASQCQSGSGVSATLRLDRERSGYGNDSESLQDWKMLPVNAISL